MINDNNMKKIIMILAAVLMVGTVSAQKEKEGRISVC